MGTLESTAEGRIASFYYLKPENIKLFSSSISSYIT